MHDGLGILSRVSGLLTVGFTSFYLAAIFVENWSSADAVAAATGADLTDFTYASVNSSDYTYSLDAYCVDAPIPAWNMVVSTYVSHCEYTSVFDVLFPERNFFYEHDQSLTISSSTRHSRIKFVFGTWTTSTSATLMAKTARN